MIAKKKKNREEKIVTISCSTPSPFLQCLSPSLRGQRLTGNASHDGDRSLNSCERQT